MYKCQEDQEQEADQDPNEEENLQVGQMAMKKICPVKCPKLKQAETYHL